MNPETTQQPEKREIGPENFIFFAAFIAFFAIFAGRMGLMNTLNTLMNTAYSLLIDTVFYLMAICVLMGAVSALFSEFGLVSLANRLLNPLMVPLYQLPGAASVGVVTTFLSDNPAILSLAEDHYFKSLFKRYQFPALTNLGTSFGMGLIVCTYMLSLSISSGESYAMAVLVGLLGAVVGSVVSTRIMLHFTAKLYGREEDAVTHTPAENPNRHMRPIRHGGLSNRFIGALLDGGMAGVKMGFSIIPGVLIICTIVMMLTNGPSVDGSYTGAAYEGVRLLPFLADKLSFILEPLFGFSSPEAVGVPITALGAAGAATSMAAQLVSSGLANAGDIAVFTAMCMCWSGYLSTHVSMMNSLDCTELISKALISHTIGGLCAGISAHWIYVLFSLF
ncbi:MAG: hypothetical protein K2O84_11920 [Oscillospiraceae bacterium]|jgi:hypothetical protein|nr:hypothetical protein [Oscillospiraceae bacterium]